MKQVTSVSVVGLGKLGSPLAACFAKKGFQVLGYDINPELVKLVGQAKAPFVEPRLAEFFSENSARLSTTSDVVDVVSKTQATFCIVPTPSESSGRFTNDYVVKAFTNLGHALKNKSGWHLFVVTSTVLPGSMDREIVPAIEKASGKKAGIDFGVCYSPLFIALGSVVHNILNPDFTLVGESDTESGETLQDIYTRLVDNGSKSHRMNFVNAELAKISVNSYVTMKISFANQLAEICEKLPGADVDVVTGAIGADTRVGKKYLKGAMGFGGPCFPRDNKAVAYISRSVNAPAFLAESTDQVNNRQVSRVVEWAISKRGTSAKVSVIGMAYKPDTPVVEESQGVMIAQMLADRGAAVSVYDPLAMENTKEVLGNKVAYSLSVKACVADADVVIVTLPGGVYTVSPMDLPKTKKAFVIDCWGSLNRNAVTEVADYVKVGMGV